MVYVSVQQLHYFIRSPFQRQLRVLQNVINICDTLHDNFPQGFAETLSQTAVSCSYVVYVIFAKYIPFQRHFTIFKKGHIFIVKLNFGNSSSYYGWKWNNLDPKFREILWYFKKGTFFYSKVQFWRQQELLWLKVKCVWINNYYRLLSLERAQGVGGENLLLSFVHVYI